MKAAVVGRSRRARQLGVASVLVLSTTACAAIFADGTSRSAVEEIDGHKVEIGYFEPDAQGDFVLLEKPGSIWRIKELGQAPAQVAKGQELLFVRMRTNGSVEVTPVYGSRSAISDGGTMLVCDPQSTEYSACTSAFAGNVPLLPEKRKLDREAIAAAVRQSGVIIRLDQRASAGERAGRVAQNRDNVHLNVTKVSNPPQVVAISAADATSLARFDAETPDGEGSSFRILPKFETFTAPITTAKVECVLAPDKAEYLVQNVSATAASNVDLEAHVDHCDLSLPRPQSFVASAKGTPVLVTLVSFDPRGVSMVKVSNASNEYVTISSLGLYYFDKIFTRDGAIELAPTAETNVSIPSIYPGDASFPRVTAEQLGSKSFVFGFSAKYSSGSGGPKTLLTTREITLKSLLPAL